MFAVEQLYLIDSKVNQAVDYLVLGSLTLDVLPEGSSVLGGTAAYAGCMAHALGQRAGIVAAVAPDADLTALAGIPLAVQPAAVSTVYENRYTAEGRVQYLHHRTDDLKFETVPVAWRAPRIVHIGPLAHDVDPALLAHFPNALRGLTAQGWLRRWDAGGRVTRCAWPQAEAVLPAADVVVLSIEDVQGDWAAVEPWAKLTRILVVTEAERGATVFAAGARRQFGAPRVAVVDPTGAGDMFAAAFLIFYQRTRDPWSAARFAIELASVSVTRAGLLGVPAAGEIAAAEAAARAG